MKEKMKTILNKVKEVLKNIKLPKVDLTKLKEALAKMKDKLSKIDFLKKLVELARKYRLILSLVFFCISILALILVATIGWSEFVVPVCILMIIEVAMAVLLHRTELWIHAILLVAQAVAGIVIDRVPLTIVCMIAYVVTTITLHFAFKKAEDKQEPVKQEEVSKKEDKKENKKK